MERRDGVEAALLELLDWVLKKNQRVLSTVYVVNSIKIVAKFLIVCLIS